MARAFVSIAAVALLAASPAIAATVPFTLASPNVDPGGALDRDLGCAGKGRSPALVWTEPPAGTKSLALTVDDPDAPNGPFVHWVVYDIPPSSRGMVQGKPPTGALEGKNQNGKIGWTAPCPPSGAHHYVFTLYALDTTIDKHGVTQAELRSATHGHVLGETQLTGTYSKGR